MHTTHAEAREYAKVLAGLHREPRIVVKLQPAQAGSPRERHGIKGLYYGGVRPEEGPAFVADGAEVLEIVYPDAPDSLDGEFPAAGPSRVEPDYDPGGGPDEPDIDDSVKCCPNCEQPNQFGQLCPQCDREQREETSFGLA